MSLIVWLPLHDGTLNNQGLSDFTISTNTATVSNNGKIGKCYTFAATTGNGMYRADNGFMNDYINNKSWSLAAWVKSTESDTCVMSLSYGLRLFIGSNANISLYNSSRTVNCDSGKSTTDGKWHHITATYDVNTNIISFYFDGVLANSVSYTTGYTYSSSWVNGIFIGRDPNNSTANAHYFYKGDMNDVRIYDHCLSPKEVKEISKGLVLHYQLKGIGSNENIFINSNFDSIYNNTSITSQHDNVYANDWGGYNAGVSNPTTVYHAHLVQKDGKLVYNYTKNANNSWLGISQNISNKVTAGKTYTFSCDFYRIAGTNYSHGGFYTKANSSATSNTFVTTFGANSFMQNMPIGQWVHFSQSMTIPSTSYLSSGVSFYIYGMNGGNGSFLMKNPKLEEGEIATAWCPNSSDNIYSKLGYNSNVEWDCSGFGNNGTKTGTLSVSLDSPRYNSCTKFDSNSYITHPSLSSMDYATYSFWMKSSAFTGYNMIYGQLNNPSGGNAPWLSANTESSSVWAYFGNNSPNYSKVSGMLNTNTWYHLCYVWNKGVVQWYVNGSAVGNPVTYTTRTNIPNGVQCSIGDSYTGTNWSGTVFNGNLSDFRIYATALSADDVKELYEVSGSVSKGNSVHAYEFIE